MVIYWLASETYIEFSIGTSDTQYHFMRVEMHRHDRMYTAVSERGSCRRCVAETRDGLVAQNIPDFDDACFGSTGRAIGNGQTTI